ncbi:MAG TPA: ATP phosphoribosyltransferase regulatory subunit, partial [Holophaga sp.]|nr:ATP phosphoribosyltransferase regulatory subunit [Holophaga sp.]
MPTHTPHYPDLLFPAAKRLRRWESVLMALLEERGYQEMRPALVLREPVETSSIRFFDGDHLVALRWDFTLALARMLLRRFPEPPRRISYAGNVFRRTGQPWEPFEHVEVGCEHIHLDPAESRDVDVELAQLMMSLPSVLGFRGGILALGHAALLRRPLEAEGLPKPLAERLVWALERRSLHRAAEALGDHPAARRLLAHAETLLADPDGMASLAALGQSPYAVLLEDERAHLQRSMASLAPLLPDNLALRLDLADVRGLGYYTGPTLRLWAPGAQQELAAGGRYDGLFPELGRPWFA